MASSEALRRFAWQNVTSVPSVRSITTHLVYEQRRRAGVEVLVEAL